MKVLIGLVVIAAASYAQSFGLPAGVEGLIRGTDFEVEGNCKCAHVHYREDIGGGFFQGHILTVSSDNSMRWDDGRKRDKASELVIVELLDLLVKLRFPQFEYWQSVFDDRYTRPSDPAALIPWRKK